MLAIEKFLGIWTLIGSVEIREELPEVDADWNYWFTSASSEQIQRIQPVKGLTLTIHDDSTFSEKLSGKPNVYWFHSEGYLSDTVEPFSGAVNFYNDTAYLRPSEARLDYKSDDKRLRADGDMEISEQISIIDNQLVRTVNVVTDGSQLDRVIMIYEKGAEKTNLITWFLGLFK
jgi:hypothetical protein